MNCTRAHVRKTAAAAVVLGLVALAWARFDARAIFVSAPGTPRLEGDTSSTEILDKTILDVDISERAGISGTKLELGTAALVPFSQGTRLATSSLLNFATSTGDRLGVGTTTPGAQISVGGSALIGATTTTSGLFATSTAGIATSSPSVALGVQGSIHAGSVSATSSFQGGLNVDGALKVAGLEIEGGCKGCPAPAVDWILCGTQTIGAATTSIIVDDIPVRRFLEVRIHIIGKGVGGGTTDMRFNGDTAANYSEAISEDYGVPTKTSATTAISLETSGNTQPKNFRVGITNVAGTQKTIETTGGQGGGGTTAGLGFIGTGVWNNTTAGIDNVSLTIDGTVTFTADSRMDVYCSSS